MATILEFCLPEDWMAARSKPGLNVSEQQSAKILIFPGVRVDRTGSEVEIADVSRSGKLLTEKRKKNP